MIRKLVILGLVILGLFFFYKKFMAEIMEPFFKKSGTVDVLQQKVPTYDVNR